MEKKSHTIILFYKFATIKNPQIFREKQRAIATSFNLKGRMLIAKEGINATFEGLTKDVKAYIKKQKQTKLFADVVFKDSIGNGKGFTKLMVKTRPEVITLGVGDLNVRKDTAPSISAKTLELMYQKNDDFVVLDLRNDYEINAGYFEKTVNPKLQKFKELPKKLPTLAHLKNKKIVAVCTGGIRCEKATVLLKKEGFNNIYQLKDGIHTYIKKYPGRHFKGSLFVFDNRMVTTVKDSKNRQVVGVCAYCQTECEEFYNDDRVRPSRKVICCASCIMRHSNLRKCIPV